MNEPADDVLDALDALVQMSFGVTAVLSQVAAEHDLSLTQLRVLAILRDHRPAMAELAGHLGLERSTVSGLVDRAVRRGLLRRDASPADARVAHVSLAPAGERLATELATEIGGRIAPLTGRLTPAERARLAVLLTKALRG